LVSCAFCLFPNSAHQVCYCDPKNRACTGRFFPYNKKHPPVTGNEGYITRPTGTVTFLFTDIQSITRLWREHPEGRAKSHARHNEILKNAIEANNGYIFQIIGDALCTAFHKAGDAVKAALQA
jgi:class 3 adenylate cyclase